MVSKCLFFVDTKGVFFYISSLSRVFFEKRYEENTRNK
tara:strand:- start:231 stop:344 length:114 start_codon:yes stop_codon:yes gene_type:complete